VEGRNVAIDYRWVDFHAESQVEGGFANECYLGFVNR
jgi:hypothetical protein